MRTAVKKRDYKSSKLGTEGIGKCVHRVEVVSACALAQCPNSRVMFCAALTFFLPPPSQHKRMARMRDSSEVLLLGSGSPALAHTAGGRDLRTCGLWPGFLGFSCCFSYFFFFFFTFFASANSKHWSTSSVPESEDRSVDSVPASLIDPSPIHSALNMHCMCCIRFNGNWLYISGADITHVCPGVLLIWVWRLFYFPQRAWKNTFTA